MGELRTGAETQHAAAPAVPGAVGERDGQRGVSRRWTAVPAYLVAAAVLFAVYLRLSETYQANSDSANILLMGSDLLHGNLLLHNWYASDVSFFPTELPQYALLEAVFGAGMQTAHIAAAMTYTLTVLFSILLARSGSAGRPALARTLIAAGILLAPQFGLGVFALDLSVGHIGTSVPLLVIWLILDKVTPRWYVPVLTAVLLAWVLVADPIVYVVGIGPLGVAAAARVIRGVARGAGHWANRIVGEWYDLSLGAASVAAVALAWIANNLISALGGYTVNRLPFYLTSPDHLRRDASAIWKVLEVFGANYAGLTGGWLALALLHLVTVAVVVWALIVAAIRFYRVSLVDQVLTVAIVLNVALYLLTNASAEASHEVAIIAPFGAVLSARVLTQRFRRPAGSRLPLVVRLAASAAGLAVLAGYTAGLGYELSQPSVPAANTRLVPWLLDHHLTYGLSGYWTSSSVTVDSGGQVKIRALMQYTMKRDLWMSNVSWYDPKQHDANFIVLDSRPGFMNHWEPEALIRKYFGRPARTYHTGPYTVLVWDRNLLGSIPR